MLHNRNPYIHSTTTLSCFVGVLIYQDYTSFGVFMKLWTLLESERHKLDLQLAQHTKGEARDREGYVKYADLIAQLQDEHHRLSELVAMNDGVVTSAASQLGNNEQEHPRILELRKEAVHMREQITNIICLL